MNWNLIDEQDIDGFTIKTYMAPEDMAPDFDDGEILQKINDGVYAWFQVKVTATKCWVELATAYLGGCCYESEMDFVGDEYWWDMAHEAIDEAKKTIEELKA